jgi:hypothetical protein
MMSVQQPVEWELAWETEVLGENLPQWHFVPHKSHMTWTGLEPGSRGGKPATNRPSYGTAWPLRLIKMSLHPTSYVCVCGGVCIRKSFLSVSTLKLKNLRFYLLMYQASYCLYRPQNHPDLLLTNILNSAYRSAVHVWKNAPHSLTHGAEPFLRSCQLCSYSRTSQHFMEPGGSTPRSHKPSTGPYPEPDRSNSYHPILPL